MFNEEVLRKKIQTILPYLNEQTTRLYFASEAQTLGRGGKQLVAKLAGVKRGRIVKRIVELASGEEVKEDILSKKKRKSGGGLKQHKQNQSGLTEALESIVNPHTRTDPMRALLWSSKSLRKIEKALKKKGYFISYVTVGELIKSMGYSLQRNKIMGKRVANISNGNRIGDTCLHFPPGISKWNKIE